MASLTPDSEVRLTVSRCLRSLSSSPDGEDAAAALRTLGSHLDDGAEGSTPAAQRAEFRRSHYTRTLRCLVANVQADWLLRLEAGRRAELWDALFLRGPPDQALLVLLQAVQELRAATAGLDLLVAVTEEFLRRGRLDELLWSYCPGAAPPDSAHLRETLLGRLGALPDLLANTLRHDNRELFLPRRYYPLLASAMAAALERTCQALRDGRDCSLTFVAQTLGKVCVQGHGGLVFAALAPRLSSCTRSDVLWQRVCWKLLENVPQRWMESVITGLVQAVTGPDALGRILGNLVLTNKQAQFVVTHKLLLLQYKYETRVLRSVLGYLAADGGRRPLLVQVVRSVSQAWANPSAVKHTALEQQLYVTKALLLSVGLLRDGERQELRSELLQCLLGGMQSRLDSGVPRIRRLGMVVGESLSRCIDVDGAKLEFQYDRDEETRELLSLATPDTRDEPEPVDGPHSLQETSETAPPTDSPSPQDESVNAEPESDLDSDDELTPYDMSADREASQASPPRYLRDCLESLMSSEDSLRVELSLRASETLVRRNVFAAREVSGQMCKVLLHMENKFNIAGFLALRHAAMVALAVADCVPVTQYLTAEFYSLNYSLRQRLDILEVLAAAAQELSRPIPEPRDPASGVDSAPPDPGDGPEHWRRVVEKRVQSKTRLLSKKGTRRPAAPGAPNRYAPVAGHFFFPLLRNYDKPQVTFDLLGSDQLVLGRFVHTLGLLMHLAVNAPVASQMGCALLDFVWTVRYHSDQMVRRGVLFAVCSVFLSMPSHNLLVDLNERLFETRAWLADVAESDPDADCRSLAVQSLVLLDQSVKKQLQDPQALSLDS